MTEQNNQNQINEDVEHDIKFTLFFSADKMHAYIRASGFEKNSDADNSVSTEVIEELIERYEIKYGIAWGEIDEYCKGKTFYKDFEVAKGKKPENGKDATVEYFFETDKKIKIKENRDESVDFKELGIINNVIKGEVLCKITPPTEGKKGMNVLGEEIEPQPGKEANIVAGENVEVSDDGLEYTSLMNGIVEKKRNIVQVTQLYVVRGDVCTETGNIRANGTVHVRGNVLSDFIIDAEGDIIVDGYVEASTLKAGRNITIARGMNGMKKGVLAAEGDIVTTFTEMVRIEKCNNLICDYCIACEVKAFTDIVAKGKKGALLGGNYIAGRTIEANEVGSKLNIPMEIQIVPGWFMIKEFHEDPDVRKSRIFQMLAETNMELEKFEQASRVLDVKIEKNTKITKFDDTREIECKKTRIREMMKQKAALKVQIDRKKEQIAKIEGKDDFEDAKIVVKKRVHEGTRVSIGNAVYRVIKPLEQTTFVKEEYDIKTYDIT